MAGNAVGYRFVFKTLSDSRNFRPHALRWPDRQFHGKPYKECCEAYALSLWKSLPHLQAQVKKTREAAPLFLKKVGDHYAKLVLKPADGISTPAKASGHFSFFEASGFNATNAVTEHEKLDP